MTGHQREGLLKERGPGNTLHVADGERRVPDPGLSALPGGSTKDPRPPGPGHTSPKGRGHGRLSMCHRSWLAKQAASEGSLALWAGGLEPWFHKGCSAGSSPLTQSPLWDHVGTAWGPLSCSVLPASSMAGPDPESTSHTTWVGLPLQGEGWEKGEQRRDDNHYHTCLYQILFWSCYLNLFFMYICKHIQKRMLRANLGLWDALENVIKIVTLSS